MYICVQACIYIYTYLWIYTNIYDTASQSSFQLCLFPCFTFSSGEKPGSLILSIFNYLFNWFSYCDYTQSPSHAGCLLCLTVMHFISSFLGTTELNTNVLPRSSFLSSLVFFCPWVQMDMPPDDCHATHLPTSLPLYQGGKIMKWKILKGNGRNCLLFRKYLTLFVFELILYLGREGVFYSDILPSLHAKLQQWNLIPYETKIYFIFGYFPRETCCIFTHCLKFKHCNCLYSPAGCLHFISSESTMYPYQTNSQIMSQSPGMDLGKYLEVSKLLKLHSCGIISLWGIFFEPKLYQRVWWINSRENYKGGENL